MAESSTSAQQALPTGNESKHITEGTLMHLTSSAFLALLAFPVLVVGQLLGVELNRWMIDCDRFCGILSDALTPTLSTAEASLYDRQIRLWGVEAQNRMRSSTVLVLSLRSLAHETIKNLVLAGIGTLIVMDDGVVTEEDLGSGFLFREEDGAVGKNVSCDPNETPEEC